jgi:hypothetical protein
VIQGVALLIRGAAELPALPGFSPPDVATFAEAYERVAVLANAPDDVPPELVADARAAAPEAERRLTDWLYAVGRARETALGASGARRWIEALRDERPTALREAPAALATGDLPRLVAAVWALSRDAVQWSLPRDQAPPAPGEVGAWLDRLGVPPSAQLIDMEEAGA